MLFLLFLIVLLLMRFMEKATKNRTFKYSMSYLISMDILMVKGLILLSIYKVVLISWDSNLFSLDTLIDNLISLVYLNWIFQYEYVFGVVFLIVAAWTILYRYVTESEEYI